MLDFSILRVLLSCIKTKALYILLLLFGATAFGAEYSQIFGYRSRIVLAMPTYEYIEIQTDDTVAKLAVEEAEFYFSLLFPAEVLALPRKHLIHRGDGKSADSLKTEFATPLGSFSAFQNGDVFLVVFPVPELSDGGGMADRTSGLSRQLFRPSIEIEGVSKRDLGEAKLFLTHPLKSWANDQMIVFGGIKVAQQPGERPQKTVMLNMLDLSTDWFSGLKQTIDYNKENEEKSKARREELRKKYGAEYDEIQRQIDERNARRKAESESNLKKNLEQGTPVPAP